MSYAYQHHISSEAHQHAASLDDWNQQYEQLSSGRFHGDFELLQLEETHVFRESANRTLVQSGHVCTGMVALAVVRRVGSESRYCGTALRDGSVFGAGDGAEFHFLAGADMDLTAVSVPLANLERLRQALADSDAPAQFQHNDVLTLDAGSETALQTLIDHALQVAAQTPVLAQSNARRMLSLALTEAVLQCTQQIQTPSKGLGISNKRRIVAKARAYMQQHSETVLAVPDICKAIGTSRRALQYAFEDVLQISPVTYLRLMRLNRVRASLLQPTTASVGDTAARWGFWHLSRFAAEYKALFGELPSTTLQRGRS